MASISLNFKKTELVLFRPKKRKLDHNFEFKIDGKIYLSLKQSHLQYGVQLLCQKNQEITEMMQKLQNRALRKTNLKKIKHHDSIKHIYKDHKILKFADTLKV